MLHWYTRLPWIFVALLLGMTSARAVAAEPAPISDQEPTTEDKERTAFCGRAWAIHDLRPAEQGAVFRACMGIGNDEDWEVARSATGRLSASGWQYVLLLDLLFRDRNGELELDLVYAHRIRPWLVEIAEHAKDCRALKTLLDEQVKDSDPYSPVSMSEGLINGCTGAPTFDKGTSSDHPRSSYVIRMLITPRDATPHVLSGIGMSLIEPVRLYEELEDSAALWLVAVPLHRSHTVVLRNEARWDVPLIVPQPRGEDGGVADLRNVKSRCLDLRIATDGSPRRTQVLVDGHVVLEGSVRVPVRANVGTPWDAPRDVQVLRLERIRLTPESKLRWRSWYRHSFEKPEKVFEFAGRCKTVAADLRDLKKVVLLEVPEKAACSRAGANRELVWQAGRSMLEDLGNRGPEDDRLSFSDMRGLASIVVSLESFERILADRSDDPVPRGPLNFSKQRTQVASALWEAGARRVMSLTMECSDRKDRTSLTVVGHRLDLDVLILGDDPDTEGYDALSSARATVYDPTDLDRATRLVMAELLEQGALALSVPREPRYMYEPIEVGVEIRTVDREAYQPSVDIKAYQISNEQANSLCPRLVKSGNDLHLEGFREHRVYTSPEQPEQSEYYRINPRHPEPIVIEATLRSNENDVLDHTYACIPIKREQLSLWIEPVAGKPFPIYSDWATASNIPAVRSSMFVSRTRGGLDAILSTKSPVDITVGFVLGYANVARAVGTLPSWSDVGPDSQVPDVLRWTRHSVTLAAKVGGIVRGCSRTKHLESPCRNAWRRMMFFHDVSIGVNAGIIDARAIPSSLQSFRAGHRDHVFADADLELSTEVGVGVRSFSRTWIAAVFALGLQGLDDSRAQADITHDAMVFTMGGLRVGYIR